MPTDVLVQHLEDIESGVAKCVDRRISQNETGELRRLLGPSQDVPVAIFCDTRLPDSCGFAGDLENALESAGWPANVTTNLVNGGSIKSGIYVVISDEDFQVKRFKDAATVLSTALETIGIHVEKRHTDRVVSGRITVSVQGR